MAYTQVINIKSTIELPKDEFPFFYQEDIDDVRQMSKYAGKLLRFKFEYAECKLDSDGNPVSQNIPTGVLILLDKDENRLADPDDWVILGCLPYSREGVLPPEPSDK